MKKYDDLLRYFFDERSRDKQERHPEKIMYDCTATTIYDNWHWKIKQGYLGDQNVPTFTNFHYLRKLHPAAQIVGKLMTSSSLALPQKSVREIHWIGVIIALAFCNAEGCYTAANKVVENSEINLI